MQKSSKSNFVLHVNPAYRFCAVLWIWFGHPIKQQLLLLSITQFRSYKYLNLHWCYLVKNQHRFSKIAEVWSYHHQSLERIWLLYLNSDQKYSTCLKGMYQLCFYYYRKVELLKVSFFLILYHLSHQLITDRNNFL